MRRYLEKEGWYIYAYADTESKQPGVDVAARIGNRELLLEVKGFPSTTYEHGAKQGMPKPTQPTNQARQWFSHALLSGMRLRDKHPESEVALCFPYFATYRGLSGRYLRVCSCRADSGVQRPLAAQPTDVPPPLGGPMAQSKKPSARAKPRASAKPATSRRQVPAEAPYLRFQHSVPLRQETLAVLDRLGAASDPVAHRKALADIVVELTRCGMDTYFMQPLKLAKAGFITEQTAGLGMAGAVQVLSSVIRNIIGGMGAPQLLSVCGSIRGFMR